MADKERKVAPIVNSTEEWRQELSRMAKSTLPSFFHMRARLPKQGRTNQVLGASRHLSAVLKTYATGGENELHAHSNEEHLFVVLQGKADFFGPRGEKRTVGKNECVLLPQGALYRFVAQEEEPLVMLRVGAPVDPSGDVLARVDAEGQPFNGYSEKNKEVPCVLHDDRWFE